MSPQMRPRDWFAVGVRLFGVWCFLRSFDYVMWLAASRMGIMPTSQAPDPLQMNADVLYYFWIASADLAMAAFLILGAEPITRFAFREDRTEPIAEGDQETAEK